MTSRSTAESLVETLTALAARLTVLLFESTAPVPDIVDTQQEEALGAPVVTIAELIRHAEEETKRAEKRMAAENVSQGILPHLQHAWDAANRPAYHLPEELLDVVLQFACQLEEDPDDALESLVKHGYEEEWLPPLAWYGTSAVRDD